MDYLLREDGDVKRIVLVLGLEDLLCAPGGQQKGLDSLAPCAVTGHGAPGYYLRFLFADPRLGLDKLRARQQDETPGRSFDAFLPESGLWDSRMEDAVSIGAWEPYVQQTAHLFPQAPASDSLPGLPACLSALDAIRGRCSQAGVQLTVILSPVWEGQLDAAAEAALEDAFAALAETGEYWNFALTHVSRDPRYFYDSTHLRPGAGELVLRQVFAGGTEDFGVLCARGARPALARLAQQAARTDAGQYTHNVPILLYHHIADSGDNGTTLPARTFEHHMQLLQDNGWQVVSLEQLISFVEQGTPLPEKAVALTFDDGYQSNYELAFPILQRYGHPATIFAIGCSIGHYQYYKDTQLPMTPHFGQPEMEEMLSSGVVNVQSHTYDMHQWAPYEPTDRPRVNILPLEGESREDYIAHLTADVLLQKQTFAQLGLPPCHILAFPGGRYTQVTDFVLRQQGYRLTVSTDALRTNTLVRGLPQSLLDLGRMNISADTPDGDILRYLEEMLPA